MTVYRSSQVNELPLCAYESGNTCARNIYRVLSPATKNPRVTTLNSAFLLYARNRALKRSSAARGGFRRSLNINRLRALFRTQK